MKIEELDTLLANELAVPARPADPGFANCVDLAIAEHLRYQRHRKHVWLQTGSDAAAALAVLGGLLLLSRTAILAPFAAGDWFGFSSPLALVLLLWVGVQRWRLA